MLNCDYHQLTSLHGSSPPPPVPRQHLGVRTQHHLSLRVRAARDRASRSRATCVLAGPESCFVHAAI